MVYFDCVCKCKKGGLYEGRHIPSGVYGDPWDASFNVHIQGKKAYVSLLDKVPPKLIPSIREHCRKRGVKKVEYMHNGVKKAVRI